MKRINSRQLENPLECVDLISMHEDTLNMEIFMYEGGINIEYSEENVNRLKRIFISMNLD